MFIFISTLFFLPSSSLCLPCLFYLFRFVSCRSVSLLFYLLSQSQSVSAPPFRQCLRACGNEQFPFFQKIPRSFLNCLKSLRMFEHCCSNTQQTGVLFNKAPFTNLSRCSCKHPSRRPSSDVSLRNIRKDSRSQNLVTLSLATVVQVPSGPQLAYLTAW